MLFAQGPPPPGGGMPPNAVPWIIGVMGCVGLVLIAYLVVVCFFLRTLSRALARCHPDNRTMSPGQVWFNLIPCFNLVWQFVTVIRVGDSLKTEFLDRRLDEGGDYGKTLGLASLLLGLAASFVGQAANPAFGLDPAIAMAVNGAGGLFQVVFLVLGILYWVRIAGYSRQLADDDEDRYTDDRFPDEQPDDDDLDRPRRRRDPEEDDRDPPR